MKASEHSTGAIHASSYPVRMTPTQAQAAGLNLRRLPWCDVVNGPADALVAAGIVTRDQLPGVNPNLGRSAATFYRGEYVKSGHVRNDEHWLNITRSGKKYHVRIGISADESKRREAESRQTAEARREREREARVVALGSSPEQLRETASTLCEMLRDALANHTPGDHERNPATFACRFAPEGIADILEALGEVREWIGEATITRPDPMVQKVKAARTDASFQSFLAAQCLAGE